ncbi:UDP-3-O-acyl-N-acetylglucosamine deacetylase [Methylobacterium aerolatum]|uniref:UDP-3-O-acyl-N-acetylglucosamine deacetylase n=1 Tax=Methylobacterium aerolatum TaxID=418708 RepID=A0ABU0HX79_9HYPH|nr:UDP-3-O-acyl-N-acetylglucosamine deacetylase [Methylobacterium aerolatum]MDQ0446916.1 UDP-3-O-[3-hydroxymyristoyl] N-acetylglucosamine deacetylase [Methylobacterium aerolatum]GJD33881.1 UDP-3-O-acyl-N-acetylglucosamine deacetylase [Methylobacterium aerolatum]
MRKPDEAMARPQATLAAAFALSGRGLHTGLTATVRVMPAPVGHGIVFRRRLKNSRIEEVPALWRYQHPQPACTALGHGSVLVRTVEHLMAALYAAWIDNALIEIDAEELPIFDGSATPWCEGIAAAGRVEQEAPVRTLRVLRRVEVADSHRRLAIDPGRGFAVSAHIALRHCGSFAWSGPVGPETFAREIAPSRSFGRFLRVMAGRTYGYMTRKPLLQGCGPKSAALLIGNRVIGGLRMPDELVRHRVLDITGDLALVGHPVAARVEAHHTCHALNHLLVAALMRDAGAWELA